VLDLRRRAGSETIRMLAQEYGVNPATVSLAVRGKTWAHVLTREESLNEDSTAK
jgi:hypothetical protein